MHNRIETELEFYNNLLTSINTFRSVGENNMSTTCHCVEEYLPCAQHDDNRINQAVFKNENNHIKYEVGRVGFEPTTPAMSRRYLNQARPPARNIDYMTTFEGAKYLFA